MSKAIPEVWDVVDFETGEVYLNEVTAFEAFSWFADPSIGGVYGDFWIHSVRSHPKETETRVYSTVFVIK